MTMLCQVRAATLVMGCTAVTAGLAATSLPETLGCSLPDTQQEAEVLGSRGT